jgi:hypothetical protein
MHFTSALFVLAATAGAFAIPAGNDLDARALPSGTVTCGSHKFSVSQVSAAVAQGYKYYKAGSTVGKYYPYSSIRYCPDVEPGSDQYPHTYRDDEKLSMYCSGSSWYEVRNFLLPCTDSIINPWSQFPILSGGSLYTGGSPGADRVIFNPSGTYCA